MQPIVKAPSVATDATFASGPDTGQPTRVSMSAGEQAQGIVPDASFPACKVNWMLGVLSDHVRNLSESWLRTWDRVPTDTLGASDTDRFYNIFAYSRGTERAGRLHILGTNSGQTALKTWWNPHVNVWHGTSHTGSGQMYEMSANPDGSILIAVGDNMANKVQRSTDGTNFTAVATHGAFNYTSCCFSNGKFFATTSSSPYKVAKSADGSTWAATATDPGFTWAVSICRAGKVGGVPVVLVSNGLNTAVTTDEGASWSAVGTLETPSPTYGARDIQYSEGLKLWMAVTGDMGVYVSSDGVNWTKVRTATMVATGSNGALKLATDGGGAWVVAGNNSGSPEAPGPFVAYSVDGGVTWTGVRLDEGDSYCGVCWHPVEQRFYVVCDLIAGSRPVLVFRTPSVGEGTGTGRGLYI
jgi:hypothetical protein